MENQTRNPVSANAILCTLHVSVWAGTKTDRDAGDDLADHQHAKRGSAKVVKSLLGDCLELRDVLRIGSAVRTALKESTLPWIDRGARLVPVSRYTKSRGITRYSAFKLPDEIQRRIAVLDMVATGDAVPGVGCRWQGHGPGNWFYDIDPWCPFDDLLATGLLTHIKEKSND